MADYSFSRRRFLTLIAASGASALLAACGGAAPAEAPTSAPAAGGAASTAPTTAAEAAPTAAATTAAEAAPTAAATAAAEAAPTAAASTGGTTALPADAAPAEYQVYVSYFDNTADFTTVDFMESVYKQGGTGLANLLSDPLTRLDKDFQVQPGSATKWTSNDKGDEWTFELDPNLVWSDGSPLTADDYVATYQYAADPKHAWDFAWYYSAPGAIKGWDDAVAGKIPVDQIGVKADGPNKVVFTTDAAAPFLPAKLIYSLTLQKKALAAHGGLYNSDPTTSVSCGSFVLTEWKKGERLVYEKNKTYKGNNPANFQKLISIGAKPDTFFAGYQAGEVDYVPGFYLQTADNEIINADEELKKELKTNTQDFRTDYLFFDCQNPPFNDLKVRQAISHVVDRDTLIQTIITPQQGIPAYSFLMPGFPAANSEGLKDIQNYDSAKAKSLLAEAGFPDGKGFPKLTLWLRNETTTRQALAQAIAATIKQELGIEVEVSNKDFKTFMESLNAKPTKVQFGMVSYGIDFLDPSNMLGVWLGTGRHNWQNADYDKLVNDAAADLDTERRIKTFQDAEKLLVTDVPAVFINHRLANDLIKPYVKGDALEPNKAGFGGLQWPGYAADSNSIKSLYISSDVTKARTEPPK